MKNELMKRAGIIGSTMIITLLWTLHAFAALSYQEMYTSPTGSNKVCLVVASNIYDAIYDPSLKQYIADLEAEDYSVTLTKHIAGTPEELKAYFKTIPGLKGVVLIGDLPIAMFFRVYNVGSTEQIPCDLYYMNLENDWVYDATRAAFTWYPPNRGDVYAQIWLGRLTSSNIYNPTMDQVALLKNYFYKNHAYRTGTLPGQILKRALVYADDDFTPFGNFHLDLAYGNNVTLINDPAVTNAADYKTRLKQNYEFVHVGAHSTPIGHCFETNGAFDEAQVSSTDIRDLDPPALFYTLNGCFCLDYTFPNYIGGEYIFTKTYGLESLGSSMPWGAPDYTFFYSYLQPSSRYNIGEAFRNWVYSETHNPAVGDPTYVFLGITLCGDPTLTLDPPISSIDSVSPSSAFVGQPVTFSGSGRINNGTIAAYLWRSSINGGIGETSSFSQPGLSIGNHTIYLKVKDSRGRWSSEAQRNITIAGAPNLTAIVVSSTQISLSWNAPIGGTFYLERTTMQGNILNPYTVLTPSGITETSYTDSELITGTTYYYRVKASNSLGYSPYSNVVSAMTPIVPAPTNLTATAVSISQINLSWSGQSGVTYYWPERATSASGPFTQLTGTTVATCSSTGLSQGTTYYYRVRASTGGVYSGYSNIVSAKTSVLAAPTNLTATAVSISQINLSWSGQSGVTYYWPERATSASGPFTQLTGTTVATCSSTGLSQGTTYYYRVRASTGGVYSGYSNIVSAKTSVLAAPTNLTATAVSTSKINLSWSGQSGVTYYWPERATSASGPFTQLTGTTVATCSSTGLSQGTTYYYRVRASTGGVYSGYSNIASAKTK